MSRTVPLALGILLGVVLGACAGGPQDEAAQIDPRLLATIMPTSPDDQRVAFEVRLDSARQRAERVSACMRDSGYPDFTVVAAAVDSKPVTNIPALPVIAEHGWFFTDLAEVSKTSLTTASAKLQDPSTQLGTDYLDCFNSEGFSPLEKVVASADAIEREYFDEERRLWSEQGLIGIEPLFADCVTEAGVDLSQSGHPEQPPWTQFGSIVDSTVIPLMGSDPVDLDRMRTLEMRFARIFVECMRPVEEKRIPLRLELREHLVEKHREALGDLSTDFKQALGER